MVLLAINVWSGFVSVLPLPAEEHDRPPRVVGTAQTEEEFQAYQAVLKSQAPEEVARSAEAFLIQYPDSGLSPYVRQGAVLAYEQLGDRERLIRHGEAVLQDLPQNVAVLAILARSYAETDEPAKAVARAESALQATAKMPRPTTVSEAEWSAQRRDTEAGIHLSLGTANLTLAIRAPADEKPAQLKAALENLHKSLDGDPQSDLSSYRLGLAYLLRNDRENACKYLAWAVALEGRLATAARKKLEQVCQSQKTEPRQVIEHLLSRAKEDIRTKIQERQGVMTRAVQ